MDPLSLAAIAQGLSIMGAAVRMIEGPGGELLRDITARLTSFANGERVPTPEDMAALNRQMNMVVEAVHLSLSRRDATEAAAS